MKVFCSILFVFFASISWGQKRPMKVTDMLIVKTVQAITMSPDGRFAAFALNAIEPQENKSDYSYHSQIYLISTEGGSKPRQVTFAKERATQPVWSPDGSFLAFVRSVDSRPQIFILPINGGEAWQLTRAPFGASAPTFSPDGKDLLYSTSIPYAQILKDSLLNRGRRLPSWYSEKPGFKTDSILLQNMAGNPDGNIDEVRAWLRKNEVDNKATVINKLVFQSETNISNEQSFTHYYSIPVQQGATAKSVTGGYNRIGSMEYAPDGKTFLFTASLDSTIHPDRNQETGIFLMNRDGSGIRLLKGGRGETYNNATLSPKGKSLAYSQGTVAFATVPQIRIMSMKDGETINIPFDRITTAFNWSSNEEDLFFTAQSNGGTPLYKLNIASRKIQRLTSFDEGVTSFDTKGTHLFMAKTGVENPSEIYYSSTANINAVKRSEFNSWVNGISLSIPVKDSFQNNSGQWVEYWMMKPTNFQEGRKYPLILEIHGGPSAMWGPGEASMWHEFQYFCSKGYGVVYANPRGSGGYGQQFLRANVKDWGAGPSSDVLTALDRTIARGWADTSKLAITGGSYAGYLVAWIISHTNRFKAACSQRGVYDLATFFGEGNAWRLVPNYFGGYPWEPEVRQVLNRESPINYVQNITTPYIIFHGDNDRRTGFVQSEMLYRSLKVLNRPVEYVRHPGGTHELTRSGDNRQRMDQMLRTWEFFERFIR